MKSFHSHILSCTYLKDRYYLGRRRVNAQAGLPAALEDTGVLVAGSPQRGTELPGVLLWDRGPVSPREGRRKFRFQPVKPRHDETCSSVPHCLPHSCSPCLEGARGLSSFLIMTVLSTGSLMVSQSEETLFQIQAGFTRKCNSVRLLVIIPESLGMESL